jgi:NAD-dependent deacetylase
MKPKLVFLTGAGVSAESGIATFRATDGLWEQYKIEDVATPEAWRRDPDLVSDFYNQRRKQILEVDVNYAHLAIARLEDHFDVRVITQNIDDLHERAQSSNVLHLHGKITEAKSSGPNQEKKYYPINGWELTKNDLCEDGFRLRPHVVWFGEDVPMLEKAAEIIQSAEIFVVLGTSLQVYPAAALIHATSDHTKCYIIDPNADEIKTDVRFEVIKEIGSVGMMILEKKLKNKIV